MCLPDELVAKRGAHYVTQSPVAWQAMIWLAASHRHNHDKFGFYFST
jgi:hypothetical protein